MNEAWPNLDQAREALQQGTGAGVKIAVLDSGIETGAPALAGLTLADDVAVVEEGLELRAVPGGGRDVYGHGTAVASIIRQLAPGAALGSFRVLGEQLRSRSAVIHEAARLAIERGYQILNCSFGCAREDHVLIFKDWVDLAYLRGCHVVAASNNQDFQRREWPGHFTSVIGVTLAKTPDDATFYHQPGSLVEFAAHGQDVEVCWSGGGRKKVSGSSFAAPHLAGLLARVLSVLPALPPLEAKALLRRLARPRGE